MSFERTATAVYRPTTDLADVPGELASTWFVASGAHTRRQFGLFRRDMAPRAGGPDAHYHKTFSESFYVLSGTVRVFAGSGWVEAEAGDFLYVPKGGVHAFKADSDEPSSMLILFAPGRARERFFQEMAELQASGRRLTKRQMTELYRRHDQYMVR
jgi:quercetin dioxygenase-like cupin family protein